MRHMVLSRSCPELVERSDPKSGITRVTIYTKDGSPNVARRMERAHMMAVTDLDLLTNAYRKGVERAKELCRQVLEGEPQALKSPAVRIAEEQLCATLHRLRDNEIILVQKVVDVDLGAEVAELPAVGGKASARA